MNRFGKKHTGIGNGEVAKLSSLNFRSTSRKTNFYSNRPSNSRPRSSLRVPEAHARPIPEAQRPGYKSIHAFTSDSAAVLRLRILRPYEDSNPKQPSSSSSTASSISDSSRGRSGLLNLGNTCFMNSILQCLLHTPALHDFFTDKAQVKRDLNVNNKLRGRLTAAFYALVNGYKQSTVFAPHEVKHLMGKIAPQFIGYGQHDAAEFLRSLLDGLHNELNRVRVKPNYKALGGKLERGVHTVANEWWEYSVARDHSLVTDTFQGQLMSIITCYHCKEKTPSCDPFLDLSVPIAPTLRECLSTFTRETLISEYRCENCETTGKCSQEVTFYRLPKVLVIQLKRFAVTAHRREKLTTEVTVPENLDLTSHARWAPQPVAGNYRLYAVSHHKGSLSFGHYVADCMDSGQWFRFDDSQVSGVSLPLRSSSAYVLFYARTA